MIEIKLEWIDDIPHPFIDKVPLELARQIGVRQPRRGARPKRAIVIPALPLRFRSGDIGIRIHVLAL